jgi:hypothetical protein
LTRLLSLPRLFFFFVNWITLISFRKDIIKNQRRLPLILLRTRSLPLRPPLPPVLPRPPPCLPSPLYRFVTARVRYVFYFCCCSFRVTSWFCLQFTMTGFGCFFFWEECIPAVQLFPSMCAHTYTRTRSNPRGHTAFVMGLSIRIGNGSRSRTLSWRSSAVRY